MATTELDARLAAIREKLRGTTMGPPLTVSEVQTFEAEHRVVLPDEYRRFVMEVADGGRGPPTYGLVRLGEVPSDFDWSADDQLAHLTRPFPLLEAWIWEDEATLTDAQEQRRESTWRDGSLVLGTDGCGLYWRLVVTGPERGQVWSVADVGASPCRPRRTFLPWFEDWLDKKSSVADPSNRGATE